VFLVNRSETILAIENDIERGAIQWPTLTRKVGHAKVWTPSSILSIDDQAEVERQMANLSSEIQMVLAGDTLTEEALPTYTRFLVATEGIPKEQESHLQQWIREWSAEEERHGTLLDRLMLMSKAFDMDSYERSKSMLIADGMDIETENDPYKVFYYTSFQEIATQVSHMNVSKRAQEAGAPLIAKACKVIAGDEAMHAKMYNSFVQTALNTDPNGMIEAIAAMMKSRISMPAHLMREVRSETQEILNPGPMYDAFSDCAQHANVYTSKDYARISGQLLKGWKIAHQDESGKWQVSDRDDFSEKGKDDQALCIRIQNIIDHKAMSGKVPELPDYNFEWLLRRE